MSLGEIVVRGVGRDGGWGGGWGKIALDTSEREHAPSRGKRRNRVRLTD